MIIARVGIVFISPENHVLPRAFSLTEPCFNNVVEYNALLIGLQLAQQIRVQYLEALWRFQVDHQPSQG